MLATDPSWTVDPCLEQLDALTGRPFWHRWRRDERAHTTLLAVLELLQARARPQVTARVKALMRHRDPEIAHLAQPLCSC